MSYASQYRVAKEAETWDRVTETSDTAARMGLEISVTADGFRVMRDDVELAQLLSLWDLMTFLRGYAVARGVDRP